jgi:organic hydroperoxide reductase OsmC/OhrA
MQAAFFYENTLDWASQRTGILQAPGLPALETATPPEFPKGQAGTWSPEHLFVASVNACLMTTFLAIADNSRLPITAYTSRATGKLEKVNRQYQITEVLVEITLTIPQEEDLPRAERLIRKAESACLISQSIKSAVVVIPQIEVARLIANF